MSGVPFGRDDSSSRMPPPPAPMLQRGQHQRVSLITSGILQQTADGYPADYTVPPQQQAPVGSIDRRCAEHRRLGDGQSPIGPGVTQRQLQAALYPTQQQQQQHQGQAQAQAHWYRSDAQQATTLSMPQQPDPLSQTLLTCAIPPPYENLHHSYPPARDSHYTHTVPMPASPFNGEEIRSPSGISATDDAPNPSYPTWPVPWESFCYALPCQSEGLWLSSGGVSPSLPRSQDLIDGHSYDQALVSMRVYPDQLPSASPRPTPTNVLPLAGNPSSHIPMSAQANPSQTPDSGTVPNGSAINIIDAANGEPTSFNRRTGPDRSDRTHKGQESKPYQRPAPSTRKTRPISYEGNITRLQHRCKGQGADEGAIGLLGKIFANDVNLEALTRPITDAESVTEFGNVTGKVYIVLLKSTNDEEGGVPRHICRLCHSHQTWKHPKDVVRHLKRDHFGLAETCEKWYVLSHSLTQRALMYVPGIQ
jgi:hypothetical protein